MSQCVVGQTVEFVMSKLKEELGADAPAEVRRVGRAPCPDRKSPGRLTQPRRAPEQGFELFMDDKPMIPMMSLNDFAEIEAGKTVAIVLKRK